MAGAARARGLAPGRGQSRWTGEFSASASGENSRSSYIGHMKTEGHLGLNFLAGATGAATNVTLTAAGHNLRLLRA